MNRPRVPYGAQQPGRLPATMIRVLAAEMSEPGRLTRGKRLWRDQAVVDILVGHGSVTAEVQGSRPEPYVVTVETQPGERAPGRDQVAVWCTCPDDEGTGATACKHVVATLFALADEVAIDPDVLARWRRSAQATARPQPAEPEDADEPARPEPEPEPLDDAGRAIAALVEPGPGPWLPPVPELSPAEHPRLADPLIAEVLEDARSHLRASWD